MAHWGQASLRGGEDDCVCVRRLLAWASTSASSVALRRDQPFSDQRNGYARLSICVCKQGKCLMIVNFSTLLFEPLFLGGYIDSRQVAA